MTTKTAPSNTAERGQPQSYAKTVKSKISSPVSTSNSTSITPKHRSNLSPKQTVQSAITNIQTTQNQLKDPTPVLPFTAPTLSKINVPVLDHIQRDRLLFVFFNMVGQIVEILVSNGKIYEGLFHAINSEGIYEQNSILLKWSREKSTKFDEIQRPIENFRILLKDVVQMKASDIFFTKEKQQYFREENFVTDTEISRRDFQERELVPWRPDYEEDDSTSFDLEGGQNERNWDQFKTNEQKFGVRTTYDELLYTTKINKNAQNFKELEQKAARLAREIENQSTDNIHMREERGQDISDVTEEELYSSVARKTDKYIPPSLRKQQQQPSTQNSQQPQQQQPVQVVKPVKHSQTDAFTANSSEDTATVTSPPLVSAGTLQLPTKPKVIASEYRDALQAAVTGSPKVRAIGSPGSSSPRSPRLNALSLTSSNRFNTETIDKYANFKFQKEKQELLSRRNETTEELKAFGNSLTKILTPPTPTNESAPVEDAPKQRKFILSTLNGQQAAQQTQESKAIAEVKSTTDTSTAPKTTKLNPNAREFKFSGVPSRSTTPVGPPSTVSYNTTNVTNSSTSAVVSTKWSDERKVIRVNGINTNFNRRLHNTLNSNMEEILTESKGNWESKGSHSFRDELNYFYGMMTQQFVPVGFVSFGFTTQQAPVIFGFGPQPMQTFQ